MRSFASMLAILCVTLLFAGCAAMKLQQPDDLVVSKVVAAPGMTKERIMEKSKVWFVRKFRQSMAESWEQNSTRTVIQFENRERGLLIANSAILYPLDKYGEAYKDGWEVRFTLQEEVKDGKARLTFGNLTMFVPRTFCGNTLLGWTSSYETRMTAEEFAKIEPVLRGLADQLEAYLVSPEPHANW